MQRESDPEVIARWRRHLQQQPSSGLSIEKYCRREGIAPGTFYAWKRRLRDKSASRRLQSKSSPARRMALGSTRTGGFVQLPLPVASAAIEVRFADGTAVHLPSGNLEALSTTLRTLQAGQREGGAHD